MAKDNFKFEEEEINHFTIFRICFFPEGPHTLCLRDEAASFTSNKLFYMVPSLLLLKSFAFLLLAIKAHARNRVQQMASKDKER